MAVDDVLRGSTSWFSIIKEQRLDSVLRHVAGTMKAPASQPPTFQPASATSEVERELGGVYNREHNC